MEIKAVDTIEDVLKEALVNNENSRRQSLIVNNFF